ncbi:CAP domain-containing protein [Thermosynechococcus sp.]
MALQLVNRDRQLNGLPPLIADELLTEVAQRPAEDMLKRQYFSHTNPEG